MKGVVPGYEVITEKRMTEKAFVDLITALSVSCTEHYSGPDSVEPIPREYVESTDHAIACFFSQRYGVGCETGAATELLKLDYFSVPKDERRKRVARMVEFAKADKL